MIKSKQLTENAPTKISLIIAELKANAPESHKLQALASEIKSPNLTRIWEVYQPQIKEVYQPQVNEVYQPKIQELTLL
jgi:hypothetical protein